MAVAALVEKLLLIGNNQILTGLNIDQFFADRCSGLVSQCSRQEGKDSIGNAITV